MGRLTGADSGPGRLPEPEDIEASALAVLADASAARRWRPGPRRPPVLVSAGGTREPLDPVRFVGNNSSGLMGVALARAAVQRGAEVTLVGANLTADPPAGVARGSGGQHRGPGDGDGRRGGMRPTSS